MENQENQDSMPWIAPAIMAGASIVTGAISAASAKRQQTRQNRANIEMQNLANQQNIDMWNMQNEYNSPSAQMERLRQAGLNPYLYNAQSNQAGAIPASKAPEQTYASNYLDKGLQQFMQLAQLQDVFLDIKAKQAGIDNVKANTLATQFKAEVEEQRKINMLYKNAFAYGDNRNQSIALALNASRLHNEYMSEWGTKNPLQEVSTGGLIGNETMFYRNPIKDITSTRGFHRGQSSLDYLDYGAGLRRLEYNWKNDQYDAGLPYNSPWYLSFARNWFSKAFHNRYQIRNYIRSLMGLKPM